MTIAKIRTATLALAAAGLALSAQASALPSIAGPAHADAAPVYGELTYEHGRGHHKRKHNRWDRHDNDDYRYRSYNSYAPRANYNNYPANYGEPVYRNTRVWQGNDGRYYCRKSDGTTGLLIGGAVGALLGREVAGRGDRTLGAILGAAGGALLGKSLDSKVRCN